MGEIEDNLANWRASLVESIPVGGLIQRNNIAYKWKSTFRCWLLREAALWRMTDLLVQSNELHRLGHMLGARILLRSGFETLAALLYLNHNMRAVIEGKLDFHKFGDLTTRLVAGSKNEHEGPAAINVVTMITKANERYPGLLSLYGSLSESAHPNFDGMFWGYSKFSHDEYETRFSNRWMELYGDQHSRSIELCMFVFHHEYNDIWQDLMEELEVWIVANDDSLEIRKDTTRK